MAHKNKKQRKKKGPKPPSKHVFSTVDMWGNRIHCTHQNWTTHITLGHPELTGREADVQKTIEDPDRISPSTTTGLAFGHEKGFAADIIRAITYYADPSAMTTGNTTGLVGTAYVVDTVAFKSRVGTPIYTKPAPPSNNQTVSGEEEKTR